jgi:hypothetical protein
MFSVPKQWPDYRFFLSQFLDRLIDSFPAEIIEMQSVDDFTFAGVHMNRKRRDQSIVFGFIQRTPNVTPRVVDAANAFVGTLPGIAESVP